MYQAVLFAYDGDWVTDFKRDTKEEVFEALADRGSRWFFYPFEGITTSKGGLTTSRQRVVDMAFPLEFLNGKSIKSVGSYIMAHAEELEQLLC